MAGAIRRAWWRLRARFGVASVNARPEVKAAMVEKYVAGREAGLAQGKPVVRKARQEGYAHEKVEGPKGVQMDRKPGELDLKRVSKSARTEARLREDSKAQWQKALKSGKKL